MENRIKNFIKDEFSIENDFENSESLMDAGILDSMGVLKIVEFIEDEYNFKVGGDDVTPENLDSVDGIVKYINSQATL